MVEYKLSNALDWKGHIFMNIKSAGVLIMVFVFSAICFQNSFAQDKSKQHDWSVNEKLFETKCKLCHSIDRAKKVNKTMEEWRSTVLRMKSYAPVLTDQEAKLIIDYLFHRYGR